MTEMKQFFKQLFCRHKWELRYVNRTVQDGTACADRSKQKRVAVICGRCGKELELQ